MYARNNGYQIFDKLMSFVFISPDRHTSRASIFWPISGYTYRSINILHFLFFFSIFIITCLRGTKSLIFGDLVKLDTNEFNLYSSSINNKGGPKNQDVEPGDLNNGIGESTT